MIETSSSHELRNVEEFRGVTAQPVGVVVITDKPTRVVRRTGRTASMSPRRTSRPRSFDGGSATGQYLFFLRFQDAARETGCNPFAGAGFRLVELKRTMG